MGLLGAKGQTRKSYIFFECCFIKEKKKLIFNSPFFFHFVLRFLIFFYGFFFLRKSSRKGKMFAFFSIDGFREIVKSFWFRNIKKKLFPGQLFFFFFF